MGDGDRANAMARWMWDARQRRLPYRNLPDELRPASIAEAYAAQEAYYRLAEPVYGAVGGAKIATTTKVMQRLMGVDHPCGGAIFARTIHASPARLRTADFVNLRIESEIALKLGADLPASGAPWTREAVAPAVAGACELLGIDPLYVANEGKLVAFVAPECSSAALQALRAVPGCEQAADIGEIVSEPPGMVLVDTAFGGRRVMDLLAGDPLPRIC